MTASHPTELIFSVVTHTLTMDVIRSLGCVGEKSPLKAVTYLRVILTAYNSSMSYRFVTSAVVGAGLFLSYFHPFLLYSQRSQFSLSWWPFPIIALTCSFLLSLGVSRRRFWVPTCLLLTLFAANAILILVDEMTDAVDHNLFPIEFLWIGVLASPAYFGALLGAGADWFRARDRFSTWG